jgi:hypothetical protein
MCEQRAIVAQLERGNSDTTKLMILVQFSVFAWQRGPDRAAVDVHLLKRFAIHLDLATSMREWSPRALICRMLFCSSSAPSC